MYSTKSKFVIQTALIVHQNIYLRHIANVGTSQDYRDYCFGKLEEIQTVLNELENQNETGNS